MSGDGFPDLRQAFRGLRAESGAGAPSHVERNVLAAFRKQHARRKWRALAAFGAIAASLIVASAVRLTRPAVVEMPKAAIVLPQEPLRRESGATEVPRRPKPAPHRELATGFLPLPYAPPMGPSDSAQVVRVKLPRESMRTVGLPVNEDRALERIQADVIVGQDGIARAIRFIQ